MNLTHMGDEEEATTASASKDETHKLAEPKPTSSSHYNESELHSNNPFKSDTETHGTDKFNESSTQANLSGQQGDYIFDASQGRKNPIEDVEKLESSGLGGRGNENVKQSQDPAFHQHGEYDQHHHQGEDMETPPGKGFEARNAHTFSTTLPVGAQLPSQGESLPATSAPEIEQHKRGIFGRRNSKSAATESAGHVSKEKADTNSSSSVLDPLGLRNKFSEQKKHFGRKNSADHDAAAVGESTNEHKKHFGRKNSAGHDTPVLGETIKTSPKDSHQSFYQGKGSNLQSRSINSDEGKRSENLTGSIGEVYQGPGVKNKYENVKSPTETMANRPLVPGVESKSRHDQKPKDDRIHVPGEFIDSAYTTGQSDKAVPAFESETKAGETPKNANVHVSKDITAAPPSGAYGYYGEGRDFAKERGLSEDLGHENREDLRSTERHGTAQGTLDPKKSDTELAGKIAPLFDALASGGRGPSEESYAGAERDTNREELKLGHEHHEKAPDDTLNPKAQGKHHHAAHGGNSSHHTGDIEAATAAATAAYGAQSAQDSRNVEPSSRTYGGNIETSPAIHGDKHTQHTGNIGPAAATKDESNLRDHGNVREFTSTRGGHSPEHAETVEPDTTSQGGKGIWVAGHKFPLGGDGGNRQQFPIEKDSRSTGQGLESHTDKDSKGQSRHQDKDFGAVGQHANVAADIPQQQMVLSQDEEEGFEAYHPSGLGSDQRDPTSTDNERRRSSLAESTDSSGNRTRAKSRSMSLGNAPFAALGRTVSGKSHGHGQEHHDQGEALREEDSSKDTSEFSKLSTTFKDAWGAMTGRRRSSHADAGRPTDPHETESRDTMSRGEKNAPSEAKGKHHVGITSAEEYKIKHYNELQKPNVDPEWAQNEDAYARQIGNKPSLVDPSELTYGAVGRRKSSVTDNNPSYTSQGPQSRRNVSVGSEAGGDQMTDPSQIPIEEEATSAHDRTPRNANFVEAKAEQIDDRIKNQTHDRPSNAAAAYSK
ncbi:uncharacterized protein LALA0_S12e03246g [Lachancea lanzarotensis]|uniref:LALA0S12e03246g1_1 n=1 Tax=Lachancea lanzarotensis TaxID=1245769 RepID=A0A0C7NE52_9SACH|nr:uncharacterized protein LALA0_S12e03246g [Lachancea lanzarotensis]CEP64627.1 LALA0S12e03246g1_1 [Lachancea lanzarotensis]